MGYVTNLVTNIGIVIVIMFAAGFMMVDANKLPKYENLDEFSSFNQTGQYTSNLQNQTANLEEAIRNAQGSPDPTAQLLNLALNAGATAVIATFGFVGVGLAIIYDISGVIAIPAAIISILVVVILFNIVAQISIGLRTGRL